MSGVHKTPEINERDAIKEEKKDTSVKYKSLQSR